MPLASAGLLMYRWVNNEPEFLLVHPGGPFFTKKNKGWWGIPKGLPNPNEDLLTASKREFYEEVGFLPEGQFIELGSIKQKGGKIVHAWAIEADLPPGWQLKCNTFKMEWPPKSGKMQEFPEIDEAKFFPLKSALEYILEAQSAFILRLQQIIQPRS